MGELSMLDRLTVIEDIKYMRAGFARSIDTKDWDRFRSYWTNDAVLDASQEGEAGAIVAGPTNIMAFVRDSLATAVTVHHLHGPEINVRSPDEATGIWAMEDRLTWPEGGPVRSVHGFGHYNESYQKVGGCWLVHRFRLTRLRVDIA